MKPVSTPGAHFNEPSGAQLSARMTPKQNKREIPRKFGEELQNLPKHKKTPPLVSTEEKQELENLSTTESVESINQIQTVKRYQDAILNNLVAREKQYSIPKDYLEHQAEINTKMRAILVDWLVEISVKFRFKPILIFKTVNLIDRYLVSEMVKQTDLQLLGVACFAINAKVEEIYPPLMEKYIHVCANAYTKKELLAMEAKILETVDFDLHQTCSYSYLTMLSQKIAIEAKPFAFIHYILETCLLESSLARFSNLVTACGAIFLTSKIFKCGNWLPDLVKLTNVDEKQIKLCAKEIFFCMRKIDASSLNSIKKKFVSEKYFSVSKFRIENQKK